MKLQSILASLAVTLLFDLPFVNGQDPQKAQTQHPQRFISDIEFLLGSSLIYGSGSDLIKDLRVPSFGFNATLGLVHKATNRLYVVAAFSYVEEGLKFKSYSEDPDYNPPVIVKFTQDILLHYLEAAVVPRYSIGERKRLYGGMGPYFGYLISNKLTQEVYRDGVLVSRSASRLDPSLNYKESDFGILMMVGSNLLLSDKLAGTVQFQYRLGLTDINQPQLEKMRNNLFSLQLGLTLNRNSYVKF